MLWRVQWLANLVSKHPTPARMHTMLPAALHTVRHRASDTLHGSKQLSYAFVRACRLAFEELITVPKRTTSGLRQRAAPSGPRHRHRSRPVVAVANP